MRVAWVANHQIGQGVIGGAEMADEAMIARAPRGVEVTHHRYAPLREHYDRVVVTRPDNMGPDEAACLVEHEPVLWPHGVMADVAPASAKVLLPAARAFVALSPQHLTWERDHWGDLLPSVCAVNPGWFDVTECRPAAEKQDIALWPHRDIWHKGLRQAVAWARTRGVPLRVMSDRPRERVLEAMGVSRWVVLLSLIRDPGPRTVIEAQLSGCEVVVNEMVGYFAEPPEVLSRRIARADADFWEVVLS